MLALLCQNNKRDPWPSIHIQFMAARNVIRTESGRRDVSLVESILICRVVLIVLEIAEIGRQWRQLLALSVFCGEKKMNEMNIRFSS